MTSLWTGGRARRRGDRRDPERGRGEFDVSEAAHAMLEGVPLNVMLADPQFTIRYVNPMSLATLAKIEHLLPVPASGVLGSSIDIFHREPRHQRALLSERHRLPHRARFQLGDEWIELEASHITGRAGQDLGYMVTWGLVTDQVYAAEEVVGHTTTVAAAIEEMNTAIADINQSAAKASSLSDSAVHIASESSSALEELIRQSDEIAEVVGVVSSVAKMTNLLALNATIESARAGEAGKGFAVVANEVKELAGTAGKAAEDIRGRIESLRAATEHISAKITSLVETIDHAGDAATAIAAAVEQQSVATTSIADGAHLAANEVRNFTR